MKRVCRVLLMLIWAIGISQIQAGETNYFLVAEPPGRVVHKDSYLLPLSEQEDIDHARYIISRIEAGFSSGNRMIVMATVAAGKDGINRNYSDPRFPEWSWHVSQFLGFFDITAEILDGNPTQLENGPGEYTIGFWDYTVVKELGPAPLYLSIAPDRENLQFHWSAPGSNWVYTLEGKEPVVGTNWLPLPGVLWPLKTNHWVLPVTNAPASFFRIRAGQSSDQ